MAEEGVYMDTEAVQNMADGFGTASDVLKTVATALEVAIDILRATAFIGMVGNLAIANYLERIKPNVEKLGEKCDELKLDLYGAVVSYRDGDDSGSKRFQD
jgi:hypothetical protein